MPVAYSNSVGSDLNRGACIRICTWQGLKRSQFWGKYVLVASQELSQPISMVTKFGRL